MNGSQLDGVHCNLSLVNDQYRGIPSSEHRRGILRVLGKDHVLIGEEVHVGCVHGGGLSPLKYGCRDHPYKF